MKRVQERIRTGRAALLLLAAATGACGESPSSGPSAPSASGATPAKQAAAAKGTDAQAAPPAEVSGPIYNPVGKRDPFRSYLAELKAIEGKDEPKRKLESTEKYELDQYRLTGLITGTSQAKALLEDPAGEGHLVKVGSHLGKSGGIVTRITSTGIVVTQETRTPTGEKVRVPIEIKLLQPELDIGGEQN